ncbi:MAG: fused MFS/spermidine synthase [Gemmatimonadetes bacterium]|nr:fused MFS/spermidine synthase [Gemmatimonadota bacterium]
MARVCLLVFFFLSGISGLIYQVGWVRQASLTFGVSVYAYSAVLAAYMIGLALGSYLMGRRIDRSARPLRAYALVEVGIGGLAAVSPFVLSSLDGFYASVNHALEPGLGLLTLLRLAMSILLLTPITTLIGATLPIMSRLYANRGGRVGGDIGRLYLVNTAGAALGCLAAGLFLIRTLGLRETILLGAALNLLVALGALALARFSRESIGTDAPVGEGAAVEPTPAEPTAEDPSPIEVPGTVLSPPALRFVAVAYAVSGFVALSYEVVWARILYIHTSHAVYSFSLMLTMFLSGLAIGSAVGARWLRRRQGTLVQFGLLQLAIGVAAVVVLLVFARLPMLHVDDLIGDYGVRYELSIAFLTLFPPALLIGLLFPVVASLYTSERAAQVGLRIGSINAYNTIGAIAGSLAAGFVLIPLLGLRDTTLALAAVNLGLGARALWLPAAASPVRWLPVPATLLTGVGVITMPPGLYLGSYWEEADRVVFYDEGAETTVAVLDYPERDFKISFVNGRDEVPTDDISMRAFRLLGHLPPLIRPQAENALFLSFGNGIATGTLNTHEIPTIDAVDLSPEMMRAAELYSVENYDVLRSPRLTLHVEDARNFLLKSAERYDIITTDATHPANASSWARFTREFYELVRSRLAPDGVFMQWVPIHGLEEDDYRTILRTAAEVFPDMTLWSTGGPHSYIVAPIEPLTQARFDAVLDRASLNPRVTADLGDRAAMGGYLAMSGRALARYLGTGPIATDNDAFFMPIR